MRKNLFTRSMKILIVSLLLLAVLFHKELAQKLMLLALILWATAAGAFFIRRSGKLAKRLTGLLPARKQTRRPPREWDTPEPPSGPDWPTDNADPAPGTRETEAMLLHISLRITEKLKSAYPQSVWQWNDRPSLQHNHIMTKPL